MLLFLSLTGKILAHFAGEVKPFFNFFFTFFSRHKLLADWFFAWDEGVLCYLQGAADKASVIGSVDFCESVWRPPRSVDLGHCFFVVHFLTHWEYDSRKNDRSQALFSLFFTFFSCRKSLTIKDLGRAPGAADLQLSSQNGREGRNRTVNCSFAESRLTV